MKKKKIKKIQSDKKVANFWANHDATETLDLSEKNRVQLLYKPSTQLTSSGAIFSVHSDKLK